MNIIITFILLLHAQSYRPPYTVLAATAIQVRRKQYSFRFFNFYYNNRIQTNQLMKNKRVQEQKWAYKFTKPTIMKFQPLQDFQQPPTQQTTLLSRIKTFFSPPKTKTKGAIKRVNSLVSTDIRQQLLKKHIAKKPLLKYVKRLTNDHILVGNQDQIDAMSISGIVNEFVDTQFMWSINIKRAILHMAIDYKKNYIILLPQKEIVVYKYDSKLIRQQPTVLTSFKLSNQVRFVQVIKESIFILCYSSGIQVLSIDENKGIRVTAQKKYDIPVGNQLKLLQIPPPYDNILNIFFQEILETSTSLALWNIEVQFSEKEVKMSKAHKVYDIPKFLKKYVRLENYSKDIYLINLGRLIYAVRKGYIIDFANVNISSQDNYLKYISHQQLMHISSSKVELYQFKVDLTVNPPRIILQSTDSIELPSFPAGYQYLDAVQILTDNFAIFYQTKQEYNKMMHGQLKYGFVLSHLVKMEDKIKQLLPHQIKNVNIQTINEKADMVNKMGLERKDIYLRLWNNSQKTSIEDYKILLDTLDYDTIKLQIQKKLKKASMNLRQMILLEQGCFAMLSKNVFGPNPTKDDIKNYFISHLLIRKFQLYRLFSNIDKKEGRAVIQDEEGKLLINIQNYNYYKTVDIKFYLYELINTYCNEEKDVIIKIRTLLRHFKFSLRINYQEILENIIVKTKKKFLKILQAIPELLPYEHPHLQKEEDQSYYEGIWEQISSEQWQKHLYLDNVVTLDNKQALNETSSNVWFKRYWLSQHEFINKTKKEIFEIYKFNCSHATFYNVIQQIFDHLKDYASIKSILDHIQNKYQKLPTHLFGKIFLYRKLYQQFKQNKRINTIQKAIDNFKDFLQLKDQNIFKVMFNFEKVKKNFILTEMKPFYLKLAGSQIFNEGLLNYFASDLSEISDIKYLLNRMNNQKIEFHEQNEGIYQVLVRGMQLKLRLGSPSDIPIDEVLIYIENIPLSPTNPIMKDLQIMRLINQQQSRFKKIKLNMSIFQMMKNVDDVIASLITYQIKNAKVLKMTQYAEIQDITKSIIYDVQELKKKIFSETEYSQLTLFVYLTKLLEEQQLVGTVSVLLEDDWINRNFNLSQTMIQNIVLYMYKWRMNHKPSYVQSSTYLKELINLLPIGNRCRQYIQAQIQFSEILSTPEENIYYPLSNGKEHFTIIQLQNIINNTPANHLLTVNIERLHLCALQIQQISTDGKYSQIQLHDLYQMIILRLIQCGLLREVIGKIKTLIQIQTDSPFNFIYPSLLVAKIAPELIDENRNLLLRCCSYLFNKPKELTDILDSLMSIKATSSGYKALLKGYYNKYQLSSKIYSQTSPLLERLFIGLLETEELKQNFNKILKHALDEILQYKEQFYRKPEFYITFIILCNDPFILIKYFYCNKYTVNMKDFRCFISLLTKQEVFNSQSLLEFAKRMFFILYQSITKNKNLQFNIQQMRNLPLQFTKEIHRIKEVKSQFQKLLCKSLEKIKFKLRSVNAKIERKKARGKIEPQQKKIERFKLRLANPDEKQKALHYPFIDSDDSPQCKDQVLKKQERNQIAIIEGFDTKFQREFLMKRTVKDIGQYISIQKQKQQRSLYYTQKYANDGIFGSLHSDKRIGFILQTAMNKAFRQSVKRSPRKMRVGKITTDFLQPDSVDLMDVASSRRSRSPTIISQQEIQEMHKTQQNIVREEIVPQVQNILVQAFIIDQIVKGHKQFTEQTEFNFQPLQKYKRHGQFSNFLKEIIRLAYGKEIPFRGVLVFIRKLNDRFQQCGVNKQWLQIYFKAQNLQGKFSLDLPLKSMLKPDGLYLDSQIPQRLFNYLLPFIVEHSDDQNVMKICKVITLAFKKADLQQQILFSYLIKLFLKYEMSFYESNMKQHQLKMQKQKIFLILNKIPIKLLLQREDELTREISEQGTKKEIIQLVIISFRRRYDNRAAEYMQQKWINKKKDAKLDH